MQNDKGKPPAGAAARRPARGVTNMTNKEQAAQFHAGKLTDGWLWFGAHPTEKRGKAGWTFRVWAPHAKSVSVVGDFNSCDKDAIPLTRNGD